MGLRASSHTNNEAVALARAAANVDQFLRSFDRDLLKMTTKHRQFGKGRKRRLGGTIIINCDRPPTEDLLLTDITRTAKIQQKPYTEGAVRRVFALKHGHDGAMLINIFHATTYEFDPQIRSIQITIPVDIYEIPKWLKEIRGTRHQSADYLSKMTNAMIITVSEERGALTVYHRGQSLIDVKRKDLMTQLNSILVEKMQQEVATYGTIRGTTTLAEDQVRSLCQLLVATPQFLEHNRDWFRSCFTETRKQFYRPATYRQYEGVIEEDRADVLRILSTKLEKAGDALARYGIYVELDEGQRSIRLMVSTDGQIQFVSLKTLKSFLDHVTWYWLKLEDEYEWWDRKLEDVVDDFVGYIESTFDVFDFAENTVEAGETDETCAFGEALQALMGQLYFYEDDAWQIPKAILIRWKPHCNMVVNTVYNDRKFDKDAEMIISMLKRRKDRSCYILQFGSMRLGGFILDERNEAIQIVTAFTRRDLMRSDYFYRLLATYFQSRNWSQRALFYCTSTYSDHELYEYSELVATEPRSHFSTVEDYIKRYLA